jgi:hypothetical protein
MKQITKPDEHEINRSGKRILREVLEPLGWVVNDVQEDYGIDCNVQIFDGTSPTGAWFHIQLKSSSAPAYSENGGFISQELSVAHARHYALEMHDPIFLVVVDVTEVEIAGVLVAFESPRHGGSLSADDKLRCD